MTNPEKNKTEAVTYRVGSLGELRKVADIPNDAALYELLTISGVEWYDAQGKWTDSPVSVPGRSWR